MFIIEQVNVDFIIVNKVCDFLNWNGILLCSYNMMIVNVFGLSFLVVMCKMKGLILWNLLQLQDIVMYFGVLFVILFDDKGMQLVVVEMIDVMFVIELKCFCCCVVILMKVISQIEMDFVVLQWQGEWIVIECEYVCEGCMYLVDVIELCLVQLNVYVVWIVVVDDLYDVVEMVCEYFIEKGVNVILYFDGVSFCKVLEVEDFDGYIFDWMFGDQMVVEFVCGICLSENSGVLIFLLIGKILIGEVSEDEIVYIVLYYNVCCEEKLVCLLILFVEVVCELKFMLLVVVVVMN